MKRFFRKRISGESRRSFLKKFTAGVTAVFVSSSCSGDPEDTIANLKVAIACEINAAATYRAFSEKAREEGYRNLFNMFRAAAAAEDIHLKNHNDVLKKLCEPQYKPDAEPKPVYSTEENLQTAINGETQEYTVMYPGFLSKAKKEDCKPAVKSFTWANLAEENHASEFIEALRILKESGSDDYLPSKWFVCPQCGGMFRINSTKCLFCRAEDARQYFVLTEFDVNR